MITTIDKSTALVLIDLQKGILGSLPPQSLEDLLAKSNALINAFRKAGLPVVLVHVIPSKKFSGIRKDAPQGGGQLPEDFAALISGIERQEDDIIITKHSWGAFFETALDEELKKRDVTQIVLGGVSASIGVEGTARQAAERGYNVSFATDAMRDSVDEAQANSIKYIFPRLGEVGTTEEIIAKLKERS